MYCEATPRDAPRPEPESPRRVPRQSDASRATKSDGDAAREILDLRARVLEREAALARAIGEKEDAEAAAASALEKLNRLRLAREEEVSTRDDTIRALEGRVRELECRDASLTAAEEFCGRRSLRRGGDTGLIVPPRVLHLRFHLPIPPHAIFVALYGRMAGSDACKMFICIFQHFDFLEF